MKKLFLAFILITFTTCLFAQRDLIRKEHKERTAEMLNLTPEQKESFIAIRKSHKNEMATIKHSDVSREEKKAGMNALHDQVRNELQDVLTGDQLAKWDEFIKIKKERHAANRLEHKESMQSLNLSELQQEQLKAIITDSKQQMLTIKGADLTKEERRKEAKAVKLQTEQAVSQVLSVDQYEKWSKMRENKRQRKH